MWKEKGDGGDYIPADLPEEPKNNGIELMIVLVNKICVSED